MLTTVSLNLTDLFDSNPLVAITSRRFPLAVIEMWRDRLLAEFRKWKLEMIFQKGRSWASKLLKSWRVSLTFSEYRMN